MRGLPSQAQEILRRTQLYNPGKTSLLLYRVWHNDNVVLLLLKTVHCSSELWGCLEYNGVKGLAIFPNICKAAAHISITEFLICAPINWSITTKSQVFQHYNSEEDRLFCQEYGPYLTSTNLEVYINDRVSLRGKKQLGNWCHWHRTPSSMTLTMGHCLCNSRKSHC